MQKFILQTSLHRLRDAAAMSILNITLLVAALAANPRAWGQATSHAQDEAFAAPPSNIQRSTCNDLTRTAQITAGYHNSLWTSCQTLSFGVAGIAFSTPETCVVGYAFYAGTVCVGDPRPALEGALWSPLSSPYSAAKAQEWAAATSAWNNDSSSLSALVASHPPFLDGAQATAEWVRTTLFGDQEVSTNREWIEGRMSASGQFDLTSTSIVAKGTDSVCA